MAKNKKKQSDTPKADPVFYAESTRGDAEPDFASEILSGSELRVFQAEKGEWLVALNIKVERKGDRLRTMVRAGNGELIYSLYTER